MIVLVIDANVARSCNDPTDNEDAATCYLFLQQLARRDRETGVIVNDDLEREWHAHASGAFVRWLARMEYRKRVVRVGVRKVADYRKAIDTVDEAGIRAALEKDVHLVELALLESSPIVSRDDRQRKYIQLLIEHYPLLRTVQWINPVTDEGWAAWFDRGCDRGTYALVS